MKKLPVLILVFILLCIFLCGCSFKQNFSSGANEYIIAALGFEEKEGKITVLFESIIINQEDTTAERELQIIEGTGNSINEAIENINKKTSQPLCLSHCAVAVIGTSISPNRFEEICDYCYYESEITLSVMVVATDDVKKLLSCQAISSIAVGYDIMSLLEQQSLRTGTVCKNRFYEIYSKKEKPLNVVALPFLKTTEKGYFTNGAVVFEDYKNIKKLDDKEVYLYSILTDSQTKGDIFVNGKQIKIEVCNILYDFEFNGKLKIEATVDIRISEKEEYFKEILKQELLSEFEFSKFNGTDIFAFGNLLQHLDEDIWNLVKNDYIKYYKNSVLTVKFK